MAHPPYVFPWRSARSLNFWSLYTAAFCRLRGSASLILSGLLANKGLSPTHIGLWLAAGTAIRLLSGLAGAGRLADRSCRPSRVAGFLTAAAFLALGFLPAYGLVLLLVVGLAGLCGPGPTDPDRGRAHALGGPRTTAFSTAAGSAEWVPQHS